MFIDRSDAPRQLAEMLLWVRDEASADEDHPQDLIKHYNHDQVVLLAIPRRGVFIGDIIASCLKAKLDLVVSRKNGAPFNREFAIGAVMSDGTCFLNLDGAKAL